MRSVLLPKNTLENRLLTMVFLVFFVFFVVQPALFSPDTYSYLRADITRFPGYILYLRGLQFVFGDSFSTFAVAGHLLMGIVAISIFFKNISCLFNLKTASKVAFIALLLFPYFSPIGVALNLTSEGLAYPLYLLLISCTVDFLFRDETNKILPISVLYLMLVLTRGQFVIVAPIIGFLFLLKKKQHLFTTRTLLLFLLLLLLPVISTFADKTYRQLFYGYFETTPYSYVNAVALPLYVGDQDDFNLFEDPHHQQIYKNSYRRLDSLRLLSSEVRGSYHTKYMRFHYNFPQICNQNIHDYGMRYYADIGMTPPENAFAIEAACKSMFPKLIGEHFSTWLAIYYTSIIHGFKSVFILAFILVLTLLSLYKSRKPFGNRTGFVLMGCLLLLSNAMIVAVASHSIMRYLFYNYAIGLLIIILLLKKFIRRYES